MLDCLNYFYTIFNKSITFVFETMNFNGVSVGWIIVSVILIGMIAKSLLNLPHGLHLRYRKVEKYDK